MKNDEIKMEGFEKKNILPPKMQFALLGGMSAIGMSGAALVAQNELTIWLISASLLLLFSIMNNGLSVFAPDYKTYLTQSIFCFMILLIGSVAIATLLSGHSIFDAGGYRTIFIIILIANFMFISMVMMIKGLLTVLSEKDERL